MRPPVRYMRLPRRFGAAIGVSLMLMLPGACSEPAPTRQADTAEVQAHLQEPLALARGQALYEGSCAAYCHGVDDSDPVLNLFDCHWQYGGSDEQIFATVTTGIENTRMVGFGSNWPEGDEDLWKVIAYLRANQAVCE